MFILISCSKEIKLKVFNSLLGSWGYSLVLENNKKTYYSFSGLSFWEPKIKKYIVAIKNIITLYRISLVNNTQLVMLECLIKSLPDTLNWYDILPVYVCCFLDYNYSNSLTSVKKLHNILNKKEFNLMQNEVILKKFVIAFFKDLKRDSKDYNNYFSLESIDNFNIILKSKKIRVKPKKLIKTSH